MKTIHYFLAFVLIWTFSCSYQKQSPDGVATNQQKAFPYQLDSIPSAWVSHENDWFEFHLPPDWQVAKRPTLDSYVTEIFSPDSVAVLRSDDYGFGLQKALPWHTGWPEGILKTDTLSGAEGQLYYNVEEKRAMLILFESYWISMVDPPVESQFDTACMILRTVKLCPQVFSSDYFKSYRDGVHFQKPDTH